MITADEEPEALVARFLSETAASGELDQELGPLIERWRGLADIGEIRQIALTRAWELRERFHGRTTEEFLAWVRQMAWFVALELFKSQGRRRKLHERLADVLPRFGPSLESRVQTADYVDWLLAGLSDRERKVLQLRYFRGLSGARAAAEMKMSPEAFSQLHYRVMLKLRKRSEKSDFDR